MQNLNLLCNHTHSGRAFHQFEINLPYDQAIAKSLSCVVWNFVKARATKQDNCPMKRDTCKLSYGCSRDFKILVTLEFTHKKFKIAFITQFNAQLNKVIAKAIAGSNLNLIKENLHFKDKKELNRLISKFKTKTQWNLFINTFNNVFINISLRPASINIDQYKAILGDCYD